MRSFQVLEKQRMTLQESDHRIDQVGKQYREREGDDNETRHVNNEKRKTEDRGQYVCRTAIGKTHMSPAFEHALQIQSAPFSNICFMAASARSRQERVLSTATLRTIPPSLSLLAHLRCLLDQRPDRFGGPIIRMGIIEVATRRPSTPTS